MTEQKKTKSFFKTKIFIVVLIIILGIVAFGYGRAYYQDYEVKQEISRLQEEVRHLETKKIESLEILNYVRSTAFAEEKARMELNLAKIGEKMAIISEESGAPRGGGQENEKVVELDNTLNIVKWWNYFFGTEKNGQ